MTTPSLAEVRRRLSRRCPSIRWPGISEETIQLSTMLRARYLAPVTTYSRVRGLPISITELENDLIAEIDALKEKN